MIEEPCQSKTSSCSACAEEYGIYAAMSRQDAPYRTWPRRPCELCKSAAKEDGKVLRADRGWQQGNRADG